MSSENKTDDLLEEVSSEKLDVITEVPKPKTKSKKKKSIKKLDAPVVPVKTSSGFNKTTVQTIEGRPMSNLKKGNKKNKNKSTKTLNPKKGFDFS